MTRSTRAAAWLLVSGVAYAWWPPAAPLWGWWLGTWAAASLLALVILGLWDPSRDQAPVADELPPTARLAHDVRTPLMQLGLKLDGLRAVDAVPAEWVDDMQQLVDRVNRLAEQVLILAVPPEAPPGCIDLGAWVRTALPPFAELLESMGRPFTAKISEVAAVDAGSGDLAVILQNLVSNALLHGRPGTPIILRVQHDGPLWVALRLTNASDQPLVPVAQLKRPFVRDAAESSGYGLGLAVVERLARASGGRLHLDWTADTWEATVLFPRCRHQAEVFG